MNFTVAVKQGGKTTLNVSIGDHSTKLTLPVTATTVLRTVGGPPGPKGATGDAALPAVHLVAELSMRRGTPVAVNRATKRFCPADALIYNRSFLVGLLTEDCDAGFIGSATAVGTFELSNLVPGQLYYLGEGGGVSPVPPTSIGSSVVVIGEAITSSIIDLRRTPPVLL